MSERVTVDKGLLERLREARTAWLKYQSVREDDSEEARRMYATACELIQTAEPLPPATHPERMDYCSRPYQKIEDGGKTIHEHSCKIGDLLMMPGGHLHPVKEDFSSAWIAGARFAGAALYREVKPLKHEATYEPFVASLVTFPAEFIGKSVRITVEEVLS